MATKKKIGWLIICAVIISFVVYAGIGIFNYLEWSKTKTAIADGGMPWTEGASKVTKVMECAADNPSGTCPTSCPLVSANLGPLCTGFKEADFQGQKGTVFMAIPKTFTNYKGGCSTLMPGMSMIAGGASNVAPYVIGCPSTTARGVERMVDWFNYIIAGFGQ